MRAAPPLQVTVVRFGIWKTAVGLLIATTVALIVAWLVGGADDRSAVTSAIAGAVALGVSAAAASLLRITAYCLRWDGESWHLADAPVRADATLGEPWSGRIDVAIDLGVWLLLKFTVEVGPQHGLHRWLPLQRRGLEAQWHPLRATLYCARPAASSQAPAVRQDPAE